MGGGRQHKKKWDIAGAMSGTAKHNSTADIFSPTGAPIEV